MIILEWKCDILKKEIAFLKLMLGAKLANFLRNFYQIKLVIYTWAVFMSKRKQSYGCLPIHLDTDVVVAKTAAWLRWQE